MNPYDPPKAAPTPGKVRPGRRAMRAFALLHGAFATAWLALAGLSLRSGGARLASLEDAEVLRRYKNPHLFARSESIWAIALFLSGEVFAVMAVVGVVLAVDLWKLRRRSRPMAMGQAGLLILAGGILSVAISIDKHWQVGDACTTMLPGIVLGLITLLLWAPRWGQAPGD